MNYSLRNQQKCIPALQENLIGFLFLCRDARTPATQRHGNWFSLFFFRNPAKNHMNKYIDKNITSDQMHSSCGPRSKTLHSCHMKSDRNWIFLKPGDDWTKLPQTRTQLMIICFSDWDTLDKCLQHFGKRRCCASPHFHKCLAQTGAKHASVNLKVQNTNWHIGYERYENRDTKVNLQNLSGRLDVLNCSSVLH